jgi:hypothetical protein
MSTQPACICCVFFMICGSTSAISLAGLNWRYSVPGLGPLEVPGRHVEGIAGLEDLIAAIGG